MTKATKLITKIFLCATCKELFTAKKYLDLYVSYKHTSTPEPDKSKGEIIDNGTDVLVTDRAHEVKSPGRQAKTVDLQQKYVTVRSIQNQEASEAKSNNANRKGSLHRKAYTVEFKMQTVRLLDEFSQKRVKNKWQEVCDERGIPTKSMIIKWNQCRSKIFEEGALNREKKNEGNIKEMRQGRKLR